MTVTPGLFKIRFPEFDCSTSAQIQMFIDDAELILNEAYWGDKYDLGVYYLTAHFVTKSNASTAGGKVGTTGAISGRAVDGVSVSYGAGPTPTGQNDAYYSTTVYGQRYIALRETLGVPACVI